MMSTPTSSRSPSVDYHSLGARKGWHYNDNEKVGLFNVALDKIEDIIGKSDNAPTSIPEIVRRIFDENNRDSDLESIREAMRPTSRLSLHSISATGHKLLALLAILQDRDCLADDGSLRLDYTKSVIRGWFHNPDQIRLDDSALRNIQKSTSDESIRLGKNRLSQFSLNLTGKYSTTLKDNLENAKLGEKTLTLNFSARPQCTQKPDFNEIAFGDMNGNSIMFLHQLVQTGMADIKQGKEADWDKLVDDIKKGNIDGFRERLENVLELNNKDKKLVLLGDLLADRTYNDWFTLSILDYLHTAGQNFSVCFSNHDACFLEFYLANKDKSDQEQYISDRTQGLQHTVSPNHSLISLRDQLNHNPSHRPQFKAMTENYLTHLVIVDSSLDQRSLYSHGTITAEMMRDMLKMAGLEEKEFSEMALQERINFVNSHFRSQAFTSLESFQQLMRIPEKNDDSDRNPFHAVIWSTGPFRDNQILMKDRDHAYFRPTPPMFIGRVVHGHTADIRQKTQKKHKLHQLLTETLNTLSKEKKPQPITQQCNFLREALQAGGSPELITASITKMAYENIGEYQTAFDSPASIALWKLRDIARQYPKSDIEFLNHYPDSANDDLARYVADYKKKNNNNVKQMYMHMTSDKAHGKRLKSLLEEKIRDTRLAAQKAMMAELETFNKELGFPTPLQSCMPTDHAQSEILHILGMKFGTYTDAYTRAKSADSPFEEIIKNEQESIWLSSSDNLAAAAYVSLDSGVGATEGDQGGKVSIFTA